MSSPSVSIIVPVYKTPIPLLQRFLDSALGQTLSDIEFILVDDASPDYCPQVLDTAAARDERVAVLHREKNGRAGLARSQGKDIAKGQYVLFADADDMLRTDMCEVMLRIARRQEADIVACSWCARDPDGNLVGRRRFPDRRYDLRFSRYRAKCYRTLNYALWNKLFRHDVISPLRFEQFEANIGEDLLFNIAALCRSRSMVTTAYTGYEYTVHNGSATGRSSRGMPYLRTLVDSGEQIRRTIVASDGSKIGRRYAELFLLKRFSIGCSWIAENPDPDERAIMWSYWRDYFNTHLRPSLKSHRALAAWYCMATALFDVPTVYRLTQLANRIADPRSTLERIQTRRTYDRFCRSIA